MARYGALCMRHQLRGEDAAQVLSFFSIIFPFLSTGCGSGMEKRAHTVSLSRALTSFLPPIKLSLKDSIALIMSFILPGFQGLGFRVWGLGSIPSPRSLGAHSTPLVWVGWSRIHQIGGIRRLFCVSAPSGPNTLHPESKYPAA